MLITAGHITALPFFRFIFQSLYYSSLGQHALVSICLLLGEVNIPIDESFCASVPDVSRVTPSLKAFISSAVRPQDFHSIVTPNKHPNCKSCRPAQPILLPEVSFVENKRLTGCLDIRALAPLSLPSLISPNKRTKAGQIQGEVSFFIWENRKGLYI